jgi:hypothetical protein
MGGEVMTCVSRLVGPCAGLRICRQYLSLFTIQFQAITRPKKGSLHFLRYRHAQRNLVFDLRVSTPEKPMISNVNKLNARPMLGDTLGGNVRRNIEVKRQRCKKVPAMPNDERRSILPGAILGRSLSLSRRLLAGRRNGCSSSIGYTF